MLKSTTTMEKNSLKFPHWKIRCFFQLYMMYFHCIFKFMKFVVTEVDKDYNAVTSSKIMEFETVEEADAWCRKETWSGYYYYNRLLED